MELLEINWLPTSYKHRWSSLLWNEMIQWCLVLFSQTSCPRIPRQTTRSSGCLRTDSRNTSKHSRDSRATTCCVCRAKISSRSAGTRMGSGCIMHSIPRQSPLS
ncbi:unnamed protein product [Acanthoscelides obtectus]|uniref:Uncharacterized protein n=1 Tax=Acanthoscelides obtectus TaxID=200917 RepID=A0A9P0L5Q0_ACAOB|nr:unnamed protein product [Acanthoscelides obtectus]CAK1656736.1 hypothetical protein AOBTE_LOCUS19890 [Acanthoscelides obtectus]